MLTLADILEALTEVRPDTADLAVSCVTADSRKAEPGSLFVALPGEKADGRDYVGDAFQRGAHLAIVQGEVAQEFQVLDLRSGLDTERLKGLSFPFCLRVENSLTALQTLAGYWRRRFPNLRVIGITGSVGKSTTKEVAAEVLGQHFKTLKNYGNLNNEIGLPLSLLTLDESYERAVLEMGFYVPGEIALLCDLAQPQVGVITNIGTVHAARAGSQEAIARGKAELVQSLPAAPKGVAILNYDDPWVREMAKDTQAAVLYYGLSPEADLWADNVESQGLDGIRFDLHHRHEVLTLRVPLIGRHSVHTALRAAAVGLVEGLTWQEIVAGLRSERTQLRLMTVRGQNGALLLDDTYNASPESTLAALNLLDELDGRRIAVLGDMLELGPYEGRGHEIVGVRAAEVVDELITVGELGKLIARAARRHGLPRTAITELASSEEALSVLKDRFGAQDVVLIKGSRGMRMDLIVAALEER